MHIFFQFNLVYAKFRKKVRGCHYFVPFVPILVFLNLFGKFNNNVCVNFDMFYFYVLLNFFHIPMHCICKLLSMRFFESNVVGIGSDRIQIPDCKCHPPPISGGSGLGLPAFTKRPIAGPSTPNYP